MLKFYSLSIFSLFITFSDAKAKPQPVAFFNTCNVTSGIDDPNDQFIQKMNVGSDIHPDQAVTKIEIGINCVPKGSSIQNPDIVLSLSIYDLENGSKEMGAMTADLELVNRASNLIVSRGIDFAAYMDMAMLSQSFAIDGETVHAKNDPALIESGFLEFSTPSQNNFRSFVGKLKSANTISFRNDVGKYTFDINDVKSALDYADNMEKKYYKSQLYTPINN